MTVYRMLFNYFFTFFTVNELLIVLTCTDKACALKHLTFAYPVNSTSFSNGCFSRDLKEIWLAKREVRVPARGGGISPGPQVLLVDFL